MFDTLHAPARPRLARPRLAILLTGTAAAMPAWLQLLGTQRLADAMRPAEGGVGVMLLPRDRPLARGEVPGTPAFALRQAGGGLWREGVDHAAEWVGPEGAVLLADAAALPQPGWLAAHAAGLSAGAEVVAGPLRPIGPRSAERDHAMLLAEIAARLDLGEGPGWLGLDAEVIGNLSLRARLLDGVEADGPLALLAGLRRRDARVRLMPGAMVAGLAAPPRLERLEAFRRRVRVRAALRQLWEDGIGTVLPEDAALRRLAGRLGLPAGALAACLRPRHFGAAWAAVEGASPRLAFAPLRSGELAEERRRARLLLAWLQLVRTAAGRCPPLPS
ncbi:hypothetical protein JMJ56_13135 [Belnapia sp. T18]|uniref:Uncharacterized protein n=1 Tax=Belnapia arida TaxID=2804533 RepID=A0ABS1U6J7_9PROT|nr:hypothetical protein [Belnapia arida]MBL6078956.1 hypothetical protein [Belnapia arida]